MGTILQHLDIVIGFQQKHVRAAYAFQHQFRGMAQVRQNPDVAGWGLHQESNRVMGIMRNSKSLHHEIAQLKAVASREKPANEFGLELAFEGVLRGAIAINRDFELLRQPGQALDVVIMLVRDQHTREILRSAADGCEALADLAQGETGIDQNSDLIGFEVRAIAGRTAAKDRQVNRHGSR